MLNKKAAWILKALSAVIIALFLIFMLMKFFWPMIASNDTYESFNKLNKLIDTVSTTDNLGDSQLLKINSDTYIAGFSKNKNEINFDVAILPDDHIKRPTDCPIDIACLCFCGQIKENEINCNPDKLKCKTYEDIDFAPELTKEEFFGPGDDIGGKDVSLLRGYSGGFVISKIGKYGRTWQPIYVYNKDNIIYVTMYRSFW